jgi:hypothetical protein
MATSTPTTSIDRVPANTLQVGDVIGTTRSNSRKAIEAALKAGIQDRGADGYSRGDGVAIIGKIDRPNGTSGRVQARDLAGKMIRSMEPDVEVWRARQAEAGAEVVLIDGVKVAEVNHIDAPKPAKARKASTPAAPEVDLHAALLAGLKGEGITPEVRWAPSGNYASLLVDGKNIGYVFKQTRNGVRVEPAASQADLPRGAKGFEPGKRSELFALVGVFATEASIAQAVVALKVAADKAAAKTADQA